MRKDNGKDFQNITFIGAPSFWQMAITLIPTAHITNVKLKACKPTFYFLAKCQPVKCMLNASLAKVNGPNGVSPNATQHYNSKYTY
jgi:hypothetical protein